MSDSYIFGNGGGKAKINIVTNVRDAWALTLSDSSWLNFEGHTSATTSITGTGVSETYVICDANTGATKTCDLTIHPYSGDSGEYETIHFSIKEGETKFFVKIIGTGATAVATGDVQNLTVSANTAWTLTSSESWAVLNKTSGTGNDTAKLTIAPNTDTANTRTVTITVGGTGTLTPPNWSVVQEKATPVTVTGVSFTSLVWDGTKDIPSTGGTATKANCTYTIMAYYSDGTSSDVTSTATVTGSQTVAASTNTSRHTAGTLTLTAEYGGKTDTKSVDIWQAAYTPTPPTLTGISFTSLVWDNTNDIPATGGTATKANCTYTITGYYSDGTSGDITGAATVTGSQTVAASTDTSRHKAGTLTLTASCSGKTDSKSVDIWQAAYTPTPPTLTGISFTSLAWNNTKDIPATGGTATKANCTYTIMAYYSDGTSTNITSTATVTGSQTVAASTNTSRHTAGTLTLTASYNGETDTKGVDIWQAAYTPTPPTLTGISFTVLNWAIDIPAAGGTATINNCTYRVWADYSDGTSTDVSSLASYSGSQTIPSSTITTRHSVGTLRIDASYGGFTDYNTVTMYQEAYVVTVTAVTITASWVTDIPATGGTATKSNCNYTVTAYKSDGSTDDVTTTATVSGSKNVAASTDTSRHTAGTLTLTASYDSKTGDTNVIIYQEGAAPTSPFVTVTGYGTSCTSAGTSWALTISANTGWTLSCNKLWANFSKTSGSGNDTVTFTVNGNASGAAARSVKVTVGGTSCTPTPTSWTVYQDKGSDPIYYWKIEDGTGSLGVINLTEPGTGKIYTGFQTFTSATQTISIVEESCGDWSGPNDLKIEIGGSQVAIMYWDHNQNCFGNDSFTITASLNSSSPTTLTVKEV